MARRGAFQKMNRSNFRILTFSHSSRDSAKKLATRFRPLTSHILQFLIKAKSSSKFERNSKNLSGFSTDAGRIDDASSLIPFRKTGAPLMLSDIFRSCGRADDDVLWNHTNSGRFPFRTAFKAHNGLTLKMEKRLHHRFHYGKLNAAKTY